MLTILGWLTSLILIYQVVILSQTARCLRQLTRQISFLRTSVESLEVMPRRDADYERGTVGPRQIRYHLPER